MEQVNFVFISIVYLVCCIESSLTSKCSYTFDEQHIKTASCSGRNLQKVPNDLDTDIQILDLSHNAINCIENDTFLKFEKLLSLNLNFNNISKLERDAFQGLLNLRNLTMTDNNIIINSGYPIGLFSPTSKLEHLDLRRNMKNSENFTYMYPDDTFKELYNLCSLGIDIQKYPCFGQGFKKMEKLEKLTFEFCYLGHLLNDTFVNFSANVKELNILSCMFFFRTEIAALSPFPKLKILDLSNTLINIIQALELLYPFKDGYMDVINFHHVSDFSPLPDLFPFTITINRTMVRYLKTICFKILDISNNGIVDFKSGSLFSLNHPECIETAIISSNRIFFDIGHQAWEALSFFLNMSNLEILDISYCPLRFKNPIYLNPRNITQTYYDKPVVHQDIPPLHFPSKLKVIRYSHVMISFQPNSIQISGNLSYLDLSYTEFVIFPPVTFLSKNILEFLDLSGIDSVLYVKNHSVGELIAPVKTLILQNAGLHKTLIEGKYNFLSVPYLQKLDMWNLHEDVFTQAQDIKHLNLSDNLLRHIPKAVLTLSKLTLLDLSFNLLSSIDDDALDWINKRQKSKTFYLILNNNPFICACETVGFIQWLYKNKYITDKNGNYTCTMTDGEHSMMEVNYNLHKYFKNCNSSKWLITGIVLLSSSCSLILTSVVIYKTRWRITFFMYRTFRRAIEKKWNVNYEYDLYVSYSNDNLSWIKTVLSAKVEKEWGLKMCLEDRDFVVGSPRADVVADAINRSRHVLFLITPSFAMRDWGNYEIERVKYEKYTKYLQKIIVITQGCTITDIPDELAKIWKDVRLIEWPNDEGNLEDAWYKLKMWIILNGT